MTKDTGNSLQRSRLISISNNPATFKETIGGRDKFDFYQFNLTRRGVFNLTLNGLKANANVALLNSDGNKIQQSRLPKNRNEVIKTILDPGIYYIQVFPQSRGDSTRYRLTLSAVNIVPTSPANTVPTLSTNTGLTLRQGATISITSSQLKVSDPEQSSQQLVYTLTRVPTNGRLRLGRTFLGVGNTFTQADLEAGRVSYTHLGNFTQLTNNNTNEIVDGVSETHIIWNALENQTSSAFVYNIAKGVLTQLTSSGITSAKAIAVSGTNVIWNGFNGRNTEAFLFNGLNGKNSQLSNDPGLDTSAMEISESNILLKRTKGGLAELILYNFATNTLIPIVSGEENNIRFAKLSGSNVAFTFFDGTDHEVYLYTGATNSFDQLTNNSVDESNVSISGSNVIWNSIDGQASRAFFYDGSTRKTIQLTTPGSTSETVSAISGSNAAWDAVLNGTSEVFLYNHSAGTSIRLTSNTVDDIPVSNGTSGNIVTWLSSAVDNQTDLFIYNGSTGITTQITDSSLIVVGGGIAESNLVLNLVGDTNTDAEVYLYQLNSFASADNFGFTATDTVGGLINGNFNFTIS
jgi:Cadherin-like/Bacterial pre-peptidase C-terminal domain